MKRTHLVLIAVLAAAALGLSRASLAVEDPMDFIQALQDKGYADVAVDYLNDLKANNDLTPDQSKLFDFAMSQCLRAEAKDAYNEKARGLLLAKSREYLDKFIKEQPNHPKAMEAIVSQAQFSTDEAMKHLLAARDPKVDKETKTAELTATRKALEEAQPHLLQAAEKFKEQMDKQRGHTRRDNLRRDEFRDEWQHASFQAILCDYYLAQTFEDPKDPKRREMLEKAAKEFDDVFQFNRTSDNGLYAHMWQGKTVLEIGDDLELAKDIFDEVLANFEIAKFTFNRETAALYCQVKQFRLELAAKESLKDYLTEARQWHEYFRRDGVIRQTEGYQAISLALAKALLAQAGKANDAEQKKLSGEAAKLLDEMVKVPSSSQAEAKQLRRTLRGDAGGEPDSFEEAREQGYAALSANHPQDALRCFQLALEKVGNSREREVRISQVKDAIGSAYYLEARNLYGAGKLAECLEMVKKVTKEYHESRHAPAAAVLAVNVKFAQYLAVPTKDAKQRAKVMQEAIDWAKYTADSWPGKPEADDARMVLGKLYLHEHKYDLALVQFQAVNPHSERYPTALYLEGYTYWILFGEEKQKPEGKRDATAMTADMDKASKTIASSVDLQRAAWKASKVAEMPDQLMESELLLAKVYMEAGEAKKAAAEFQPLIDEVKRRRPASLDETMLAIFLGGVRAYVAANDLPHASDAGMKLVDLGPDTEAVNKALLRFAQLLDGERKKAEADVIREVDATKSEAAKARVAGMNKMLGDLLTKLASRENVPVNDLPWVAKTSSTVGQDTAAKAQCERFLKRVERDPKQFRGAKQAQAVTLVRTLLVHLLGKTGEYEEALRQVADLIAANQRALDPRVEQCRLLYAWAMKDPGQLVPAQKACEALRSSLDRIQSKKPPEYYEVVYLEALCLCTQAEELDKKGEKATAADAAKKAAQILKYAMFNNKDLDGPDRVEQYKKVIERTARVQGPPRPKKKKRLASRAAERTKAASSSAVAAVSGSVPVFVSTPRSKGDSPIFAASCHKNRDSPPFRAC
jgi:hypothetical protein